MTTKSFLDRLDRIDYNNVSGLHASRPLGLPIFRSSVCLPPFILRASCRPRHCFGVFCFVQPYKEGHLLATAEEHPGKSLVSRKWPGSNVVQEHCAFLLPACSLAGNVGRGHCPGVSLRRAAAGHLSAHPPSRLPVNPCEETCSLKQGFFGFWLEKLMRPCRFPASPGAHRTVAHKSQSCERLLSVHNKTQ